MAKIFKQNNQVSVIGPFYMIKQLQNKRIWAPECDHEIQMSIDNYGYVRGLCM